MYRSHRIVGGFPAVEILRGVSMGAIGTGALAFLFQPSLIRLDVIVHVWWMSGVLIVALRSLLHYLLISVRNAGRNLHFVLVIGSGNRSVDLIKRMCEPTTGYRVIGYVDDSEESKLRGLNGVEYLGTITTLPRVLAERVVDEVFMLLPMRSHYDSMAQVISHCEEQGIPLRIPIDLFVPGTCTQYIDAIDGMPVLSLVPSDAPQWYVIIKRC
jgi:FlaA1/EpsC-like NDP-sugar epimerase